MSNKITISNDEVNSTAVDEALRRQQRAQYMTTEHTATPELETGKGSLFYNTALLLAVFGVIGGLLGWACGVVLHSRPDYKQEAIIMMNERTETMRMAQRGEITDQQRDARLKRHERVGNLYYAAMIDSQLDETAKSSTIAELDKNNAWADFFANVFFYAVSGMMIATMLAIAEPITERNSRAAIINGSVGAGLGLLGGLAVSLFVGRIHDAIINFRFDESVAQWRFILADAATWGVLGMFLSIAPGLIMRSWRKLVIGMLGGLAGGILGGVLFEPIAKWSIEAGITEQPHLSRLVAICTIGLVAGLSTGLIENVAKAGWLKVTGGLIAGKQFVLYRNPTYIGSSLSCNIYLFKDPHVGPRHAAIHLNKSGFELEDLPLGCKTLVNGKSIMRHKLRDGDEIRISNTQFVFHTRKPAA